MRVLKFGGTSLADADRLRHVAGLVHDAAGQERVVAVVSALAGVTDELAALADEAAAGGRWQTRLARLQERHVECAHRLGARAHAMAALARVLRELARSCEEVERRGECRPTAHDAVLACGERMAQVLACTAVAGAGAHPVVWDTRRLVVTDSSFGAAAVDRAATETRVRRAWRSLPETAVPVATGFIAADADGRTTTLGRGGSDYTASLLGAALGAAAIEIWSDVDGVLSAPPALFAGGHTLPRLSYGEAEQLARFGGKVLHPATMAPAADAGIPIVVRNTFAPEGPFTTVADAPGAAPGGCIAVSALSEHGMVAAIGHGIAARALALRRVLHRAGIAVAAAVDTASPDAVAFALAGGEVGAALEALHATVTVPEQAAAPRRAAVGR